MINAAIVGVGRWGQTLVNSVHGNSNAIRFTRGVTRTVAKAAAYCGERDIELGDDYGAILADPAIDAVVLATPHTQHAGQITAAAAAGKHVFTEKPLTLSRQSAVQVVAACQAAGVALGLGHNRRFAENTVELKRMIDAGELGTLMYAESNFSADLAFSGETWRDSRAESPAGGMTSLGIHALDCLIHLCGPIREVDARSVHRALPFDVDDATCAIFQFSNGMIGSLATMAMSGRLWHVRVFGSAGWAELRGYEQLVHTPVEGAVNVMEYGPDQAALSLKAELEAFAVAAQGAAPFPITPDQMVHGVAVLEAIIASAEGGGRISVA